MEDKIINAIVIYKAKCGFVKRYAKWIARELSADISEYSKISIKDIESYDTVIFGGGLYSVGIDGVKFITKNLNCLKDKKIIVFATGVTPVKDKDIYAIKQKNLNNKEQSSIEFFYMRGGFDYSKLNKVDKVLMTLLKFKLKHKSKLTSNEKGMLMAYDTAVDFTKKEDIDELISYAKL